MWTHSEDDTDKDGSECELSTFDWGIGIDREGISVLGGRKSGMVDCQQRNK